MTTVVITHQRLPRRGPRDGEAETGTTGGRASAIREPVRWHDAFAGVTGAIVSLAALWSVVSLVLRGFWRVAGEEAFGVANLPVGGNLFSVALLFLLAGILHRRLRIGLWILVLFQALALLDAATQVGLGLTSGRGSILAHFGPVERVELLVSAVAAVALIPVLVAARDAFPAHLYPASRRTAVLVLSGGLAASAALSLLLTELFPHTLSLQGERVLWALRLVVGVDTGRTDASGVVHRGPHWIAVSVTVVSALALLAATVVFLRAAQSKLFATAQDELDLRELLVESGARDSLGYFATRRDKSVVFGPGGRAAVTHRVLASVSLVSGDPLGAPDAFPPAIRAWLQEARSYGWYPAVLGAGEEGARAFVAAGLKAIPLGDEAIILVREFSLRSPQLQPVRRAVERMARAGYTMRVVRHGELGRDGLDEIARRAEEWRGDEPERGFSMALNRLGDETDARCVAVLAHDPSGRMRGVLSFVPWGSNGLSLDVMRRDPSAENGVTEAMVAALMAACPDLGVARVSLNFAVLRGIFEAAERVGAGPLVRTGNAALVFASRFWQLQTLYRTTARYRPHWEPRYLCYDSVFELPRVAVAAMMAEGFLPLPPTVPPPHPESTVTWEGRPGVPLAEAVAELERRSAPGTVGPRLSEQQRARRAALQVLIDAGMDPYPPDVPHTGEAAAVRLRHGGLAPGACTGEVESLTGRVRAVRDLGGLVFADLQDGQARIQVMLARDRVGAHRLRLWRRAVDLGDQVSLTGEVVASDTGELSLLADSWAMAAKCLEPFPGPRARFTDPETRLRDRHLDLALNAAATETVLARSRAVRAIRQLLADRGFSEVETPILQSVHGGAHARPFLTSINAYGIDLYLRIAPELFLKRLAVGGMQRVFELGRNFRNEGVDATHNPEFTSLEAYQAFADYTDMRRLVRDLILAAAVAVHGAPVAHRRTPEGEVEPVDLSVRWSVLAVHEAVSRATGARVTPVTSRDDVIAVCRRFDVAVPLATTAGEAVVQLYEALVEPCTTTPTFYTDFPVETSPLARVHRGDPRLAERWDLVAYGAELATAHSELTDPIDQRRRLTEQSLRAAAGDPEAMQLDEAFLRAMEYGMPPTGGLGLGVDRLIMLLTGGSIRSTLTFPFVRP
jgi:lysyl-tRNA synthetase class 2